jgi:RNA polymerase sigma factor (sigma-70 family)
MNQSAVYLRMSDPEPEAETRRRYEDALVRAMGFAERYLPRDQAQEIAHDVACEMLRLGAERATGALIYVAVTSRLRTFWRSAQRRAALEGAYRETQTPSVWADPGASLELGELRGRIDDCIAAMPPAMRQVFVLLREEELSYKDAASRLGVSVATVHTQIARASARLRDCVGQYRLDAPGANSSRSTGQTHDG